MSPRSNPSSMDAQNGSAYSSTAGTYQPDTSAHAYTSISNTAAAAISQARYPRRRVPPRRPSDQSAYQGDNQAHASVNGTNGYNSINERIPEGLTPIDSESVGYYPADQTYFLPPTADFGQDNAEYARELTVEEDQIYNNPPATPSRQQNDRESSLLGNQERNTQQEQFGIHPSRSATTESSLRYDCRTVPSTTRFFRTTMENSSPSKQFMPKACHSFEYKKRR
ncbi:hypothetical protein G7Y89_g4582 [Cudoniella acicularis]|uniref:Uncharacterized protein n=1 Tax=Cudoniella acicularis TaxID=354080 RepID=A0A8H4RR71_9HELO|nr:hypothetical protein G7Y89_g4582 [Cudoniella acicularis]